MVAVVARDIPASAAVEMVTVKPTGAAQALLRGVLARAEGGADFTEGFVLEVTQQDGGAVGIVERVHGFVEERFDVRPVGGGGVHGIHLRGDLFAQLPARLAAHDVDGGAARDLIQPRGQNGVGLQPVGTARQIDEGGLGDFFGELRRADLAQRRGIDQAEMAPDDFGEGILGVLPGVAREEFQVGVAHVWKHIGADLRNKPKNSIGQGSQPVARPRTAQTLRL